MLYIDPVEPGTHLDAELDHFHIVVEENIVFFQEQGSCRNVIHDHPNRIKTWYFSLLWTSLLFFHLPV